MRLNKLLFVAAALLTTATSNAHAFDAKRQGFQAGIGVGAHTSKINHDNNLGASSLESEQKLAVDFQLGYGFSNRIVGFLGGKGGSVIVDGREGSIAISGVGGTLYWSDTSPSLYVTGVAGIGSLSMDGENADQYDTGTGWLAGVGFEVAKGLHLELSYARANLTGPVNEADTSALESTFATVKYIWY